jgi:hypothetical protein
MKRLLFAAAIMLTATQAFAGQVTVTQAQAKAQHFMQSTTASRLNIVPVSNLRLLYTEMGESRLSPAAYYVFNADNAFVIVAGDDRAQEILAYGEGALDIETLPENMRFWLGYYKRQMEYLQAHPGLVVEKPLSNRGESVEPMLEATWDQGAPYYNQCPLDGGTHAMTGCATTSLAQVFYHWKFPTGPTPVVPGYTTRNGKFTLEALPSVTFDWDHMLPRYWYGQYDATNASAVAQLMRYIGQAEEMNYDKAGSDAWEDDIVRACDLFGYEDAYAVYKSTINFDTGEETTYINDEDWSALMQEELLAGHPFVFCAFDYSNAYTSYVGHAFNVDGYNATDGTFHINWGWSGTGNGYFAMNAFANQGSNYHMGQRIVKNIYPSLSVVPTIKVRPDELNMQSRVGEAVKATFSVKGKLLTEGITLTLNDADGVFALDETSVTLGESQLGKVIAVTYCPTAVGSNTATVSLSSPGAEDQVVTLNGTASIAGFDPVMLPANENYITLTSFRADWTDETEAQDVAGYTLDVITKPGYFLLDEADWSNTTESFSAQTANAANYFPNGWTFTGSDLWAEDGFISINGNFSFSTPAYDMDGANKVTVVFTAKSGYPSASFTVSTSVDSEAFSLTERTFEQYVAVLDCADVDKVTITNTSGNPGFLNMQIYAGEIPATRLRAHEEGDATWRLITGITDKFYTVSGLTEAGTFQYKVKVLYTDGTESAWSNTQTVTLTDNGSSHGGFKAGDVNHDSAVNITDVLLLINYLSVGQEICTICGDVNHDTLVNITDVTALINTLVNGY